MAERTLASAVEDAARRAPAAGLTIASGGVPGFAAAASEAFVSYALLEQATGRRAGALQALGLRKGDRAALVLPDPGEFVTCFLGALRAGIIPVPISPPLGLGEAPAYLENIGRIVAKSGARALITSGAFKRTLDTLPERARSLGEVVAVEDLAALDRPPRGETITPDDVAFLQFTSGSTSQPKGVVVTHGSLLANVHCIVDPGLRVRDHDVFLSWLPLFHDMGLVGFMLAPLARHVSWVLLSPADFLKRPITWLQAITRYRGTVSYAPNFAYALCCKRIKDADLEAIDLRGWRVAGCGAEPIRAETLDAFARRFAGVGFAAESLVPSYGMAESTLAISFAPLGQGVKAIHVDARQFEERGVARRVAADAADAADAAGGERALSQVSCGRAFPGHEIALFAPDDQASASPLGDGQVGELRLRGPSIMRGYWDDEAATQAAFAGPFLRTGDLGFLLDGDVYVCGRLKELIIVNGRNYYPQDLEWAASTVPGIRPGNVIAFGTRTHAGAPSATERAIVAFEVQEPDLMSRADELRHAVTAAVRDSLLLAIDDAIALPPGTLPKTSSGKLQRTKLRALYESGALATPARNHASSA